MGLACLFTGSNFFAVLTTGSILVRKMRSTLLEPRVLKVDSRRIEVLLPFQPISGDYWLKIGPSVDAPALTALLRVENDTMSIASEDYDPEFDRLVQHSSAQKKP